MLSEVEYKVLKVLEDGLPLASDPYGVLAQKAGLGTKEFCAVVERLKVRGVIRRMGVVLRHQAVGVKGNIMAAFNLPPDLLAVTGKTLAQHDFISHCYARKSTLDWPYNLYAMLHAQTLDEARELAKELCRELNITEFILLPTVTELKKSSFRRP